MFEVFNTEVYGIHESLIRMKYPKLVQVHKMEHMKEQYPLDTLLPLAKRLGSSGKGEGHDKYLRFIIVQADANAPRFWWQEFDTYHFVERMSQSTMHCIDKMDIAMMLYGCVDVEIAKAIVDMVEQYKVDKSDTNLHKLKANLPEGLCITSALSTNYSQLKTIYAQRKTHRLPEWREFCVWVESLPYARELGVIG